MAMATAGYAVAPVRITLKSDGRKRLDTGGASWSAMSTTDVPTIAAWFAPSGPYAGWSYVVDTEKSGIVVVDLDGVEGVESWRALGLPSSLMSAKTRSGGFHGYYAADPSQPVYNSTSGPAECVDIRGIGGVVFGPGSMVEGHAEQQWVLGREQPVPVASLPTVPAEAINRLTAARGHGRALAGGSLSIQREQAYANLLAAADAVRDLPLGYGVNTAIWRLGAEAGQWAAALEADDALALDYVLGVVRERFGEADADDVRAAERGVETGLERPWQFFTLQDMIGENFTSAGLPAPAAPTDYIARCATPDEIDAEPEPPSLVEGVIDAGTFGLIYGPGGSGKSFVALDIALCVASGQPWQGHATTQQRVCFVAAEGRRSAGKRTKAWRKLNAMNEPPRSLMIYGQPVDLFGQADPADWPAFVDFVRDEGFGVVVIDTYNRCTPGLEENSAKDTGVVVSRLATLTRMGVTVIVIHHTPKDGGKPRGSAALEWGTDWGVRVAKSGAAVTVVNDRQKDRDDGGTLAELTLVASDESAALAAGAGKADSSDADTYYQPHYPAILRRLELSRAGMSLFGDAAQIMIETRIVAGKAPKSGAPQRALRDDIRRWYSELSNPPADLS